jgi:hypothetical protein
MSDGSKGRPKITAGLDLGDRYSYLCHIDTDSGEVIEEGRLRTTPEALRRLMCNSDQRRRSPDRMLHQTLSKGWCRHGSGLLLSLIVRTNRRLVEA